MPNATQEFLDLLREMGIEVVVVGEKPPTIISKSELTAQVIAGQTRECFDHTIIGSFDITEMRNLSVMLHSMGRIERIRTDIAPLADHIRKDRDFEPARVDELPIESLDDPILGILLEDGDTILVDGSHRVLRAEKEGRATIRMYHWPYKLADALCRIREGWGKLPGVDWGDPDFFAQSETDKRELDRIDRESVKRWAKCRDCGATYQSNHEKFHICGEQNCGEEENHGK